MSTTSPRASAGRRVLPSLMFSAALMLVVGLMALVGPQLTALGRPSGVGRLADGPATGPATPGPALKPVTRALGFSPGFEIIDAAPRALRRQLRRMRAVGAGWVRIDVSWARVEATRGHPDWVDTDRVVQMSRAAGLKVLGALSYQPRWAATTGAGVDVDPAAFAAFAAAAAHRYAGRVHAWELWNEPNVDWSWPSAPDPAAYARLVDATAPRLHRQDPAAMVVVGSLAPAVDSTDGSTLAPETFLTRFYASPPRTGLFDAVSVHPYSYPALPASSHAWNTFHRLPRLHSVMARAGDAALLLWITEYGAPTGRSDRAVDRHRQARMLVSALHVAARLSFLGPVFVYSLQDSGSNLRDPEQNFGVLDHRGRPKPSYLALRRTMKGQ